MNLTRTSLIRLLRIGLIVIAIAVIIGYALWRSSSYARGPVITIFEPANGSAAASPTITIKGRADRVNSLTLNGQPISLDEQGDFVETIIVFPGLNKLTFTAQDQFGRSTETNLDIVGTANFPAPKANTPIGTTTATSTRQ